MADEAGPFQLPQAWVHTDEAPTWEDLAETTVLFVRWRLDRWPTRERLHTLDRAARRSPKAAHVLGLHPTGSPGFALDRVRDVLLARGTWAPTGLLETGSPTPLEAAGEIALVQEGEIAERFDPDASVDRIVDTMAERADDGEVGWRPRGAAPGPWPLAFPADVAIGGSRIGVADTGHNRVLVARPGGEILHLVGDGVPDTRDGSLTEARFEAPHGVCWRGEELLVADTGNDAIRSVRPATSEVTTLVQAPEGSLPAGLACTEAGEAVVALAGHGCLARLDDGELEPLGEPRAGDSHPVDVVHDGDRLLVADLNGARLDRVDEGGQREAVWEGEPLVEPAGLLAGERLLVADPGGGCLRSLDIDAGESRLLLDQQAGLEAPSAVDEEAERLVVADGGGHHLWRADLEAEDTPTRIRLTESPLSLAEHIRLDPIEVAPGGDLELSITYITRGGASMPSEPSLPRASGPVLGMEGEGELIREEGRLRIELTGTVAGSGSLRIRWNLTGEDVGHEAAWDLPIVVRPGADDRLRLALSTSPA